MPDAILKALVQSTLLTEKNITSVAVVYIRLRTIEIRVQCERGLIIPFAANRNLSKNHDRCDNKTKHLSDILIFYTLRYYYKKFSGDKRDSLWYRLLKKKQGENFICIY